MPSCSVALSGDYSCLRKAAQSHSEGSEGSACKQAWTFSIWYLLSLVTCCLSLRNHLLFYHRYKQAHVETQTFSFFLFPLHALLVFFYISSFRCRQVPDAWLYCLCVCVCVCVCVSMSAKHFLLSDSAVIGISSYRASEQLSLALLSSLSPCWHIFSLFHGTPHISGSLCAAQKLPDVIEGERERDKKREREREREREVRDRQKENEMFACVWRVVMKMGGGSDAVYSLRATVG